MFVSSNTLLEKYRQGMVEELDVFVLKYTVRQILSMNAWLEGS